SQRQRGEPVTLLRPVTACLLLVILLLAHTALGAATEHLRKARTHATQQEQVNELSQREQPEHLQRAQELHQTQRQLDQLRDQDARRPGRAAPLREQQLNQTQRQLDQLKQEQQLQRLQYELQMNQLEREHNPFRRQ